MSSAATPDRAANYGRCSSQRQAERDLSVPAQLEHAGEYARRRGYVVVGEYTDNGFSGSDMRRPGLQRMLACARAGQLDVVVVWDLSRFTRNLADQLRLINELRGLDVRIESIREPSQAGAAGNLTLNLFGLINEFQLMKLSEDTQRGMRRNASLGNYNGGTVPTGYARGPAKGALVVDPVWAPVVRELFRLALRGNGAASIARMFNDKGQPTRRGRRWSKNAVLTILRNERYTGTAVWGKRQEGKFATETLDPVRVPRAHPAIVSAADFAAVQVGISSRRRERLHPWRQASTYLLSGLVFCGHCGSALAGHGAKSNRFHYYGCQKKMKQGATACPAKLLRAERLEAQVADQLRDVVLTQGNLERLLGFVNEELAGGVDVLAEELGAVEAQLTQAERKLGNLYDAIASGDIPHSHLAEPLARWTATKSGLETKVAKLREQAELPPTVGLSPAQLHTAVENLRGLLDVGTRQERRSFLRAWIRRITARGYEDVQVEYAFPAVFSDDGSGSGSLAPVLGDIPILGPEVNEDRGMKGWFEAPDTPRAEPAVWRVLPKGIDGSPPRGRTVRRSRTPSNGPSRRRRRG